jgi:hypothetical protein
MQSSIARRFRLFQSLLLFCSALIFQSHAWAQNREIRLRTGTIFTPPPATAKAQSLADQKAASGLYLVQLNSPLEPAWRAQLKSAGVAMLKYVPDDAFITSFNNVSPATIRSLSFVRWVGPYSPGQKIHPKLLSHAQSALKSSQAIAVNALVSAQATPAELAVVRSYFVKVADESALRQGTIVRGQMQPAFLDQLAASSAVLWIERTPKRKLVDEAASKLVGGDDGQVATRTTTQQLGFDGSGIIVSVADTGLDTGDTNTLHPDVHGRVVGFKAYGSIPDGSDGYGHGTHCAGIVAGNAATGETDPDTGQYYGLGVAPGSLLFIQRIFDDNAGEADPFPSDATLTQDAVQNGAAIGSNSWGNDVHGEYDTDSSQFDELVRDADPSTPGDQPYILEFSSGNAGPDSESVGSPATGKNVLTTGASENQPGTLALTYGLYGDGPDTMADFSSRGPCEDGRIKPDVVAPGTWIASLASFAAFDEASVAWSPIDDYYVYMGGTSMAGPHAAGAAAVFAQFYKSTHTNAMPSPALVKAALINSANKLDDLNGGPGPVPNNDEGWGRINLANIVFTNITGTPRYFEYVDQSALLTNGQVYVRHTLVQNSDVPLKLTLAYTDVAGFPGAIPALVNDLDLEVVAPDGTVYRGNQFASDDSAPNPPTADDLNNVEGVYLSQPIPGDYTVRVRATHVVQDARLDTASIDQDFALVISGNIARPGLGAVLLDRASYSAASTIQVSVFDPARAAASTVNVLLKSTTEPAGESIALHPAGSYGAFTGAVATVVGVAVADGKLEIHDQDAIEADYADSLGIKRVATAAADFVPPAISGVTVTTDLGLITISWQTSEPATSTVRYGTNSLFNLAAGKTGLSTTHLVRLTKLAPGQSYKLYIVSADAAGNSTTNSNAGAYYSFLGIPTPNLLFVNAYDPVSGSPEIPDASYTNAFNAAGFSFAHWKMTERGSPQLEDLQAFPLVVWRVIDDIVNYGVDEDGLPDPSATNNTLTAQQQFTIKNYLNSGGSFFMSSMGILSQIGNVPFRKNVFQVAGFKQNPDPPAQCADCDEYFGVPAIVGNPETALGTGINMVLDYSAYPSFDDGFGDFYGPDFSDTFTPATNATALVFEPESGKPCGMAYPRVGVNSPGRVVFLSFPLDTMPAGSGPNTAAGFLRKALNFLTPGANGLGTITLDNATYSAPDRVVVEVGDSDLAGTGQTQVAFSTSSSTNVVVVTAGETTHPGLFRGFLTLATSGSATNQLVVHHGDILTAKYFDASNNSNVVTTASIDTVAPVITNVTATTRYGDAVVTWTTSKPADSLVQFGESVLLQRTAYDGKLVTNHVVNIASLLANKDYFYQVTSRDAAGNAAVDDNHGALYTFTTQKAPSPPWFDDLESGAGSWTVIPDPTGSDRNWALGQPSDGRGTQSGTNVWGSNLSGTHFNFIANSYLYSPFIDLSEVSTATLTFWHQYDYTSTFEQGAVGISTNTATKPADIPGIVTYGTGSSSDGWVEETISLNAYIGKTIQVVWNYQGVDIGAGLGGVPLGWLVDDVSITGTVAGSGGTITITKNLGQGTFTLNGPIRRTGKAISTVISNAPSGPYTITFSDVAFYQTPASQSNFLNSSGSLAFNGAYDFLDANRNNISDSWEKYYFGAAGTNRTHYTDTDGDGMPDYAEFIAGTDPTNAESKLVFLSTTLLPTKRLQVEWAAIPGRLYQIQASPALGGAGGPQPKLAGLMSQPGNVFKLHVEGPANAPYVIQVSTNFTAWTAVATNSTGGAMDFTDTQSATLPRRFYRAQANSSASAAAAAAWTPVSDWLQANGSPMIFTTTNAVAGASFYRVQVRP